MIIEDVDMFYELTKKADMKDLGLDLLKGVSKGVSKLVSRVAPSAEQAAIKALPKIEQGMSHVVPIAEKAIEKAIPVGSKLVKEVAPLSEKVIEKAVGVKQLMHIFPDFSKNPKMYEVLEKSMNKAFSSKAAVSEFASLVEKGNAKEIAAFISKNVEKAHINDINKFLELHSAGLADQVKKLIGKVHIPFSSLQEAKEFFKAHPNMSDAEKLEFASKLWTKGANGKLSLIGDNVKLIEKEFGIANKVLQHGAGVVGKLEQVVVRVGKEALKEVAKNQKLIQSLSKGSWTQRAALYFGEKTLSSYAKGLSLLTITTAIMTGIYGHYRPKTGDENLNTFVANTVESITPLDSDGMIQNIQSSISYKMDEEINQKTKSYWSKFVPYLSSYLKLYQDAKSEQAAVASGNITENCKMKLKKLASNSDTMSRNIDKIYPYVPDDLANKLSEIKSQCEAISSTINSTDIG